MATKIASQNTASQTVTTTAETVVVTTNPYVYDFPNPFVGGEHTGPGGGVTIAGLINVNPAGTAATSVTVRVRQGSLTGTIVDTLVQSVVAGNSQEVTYSAVDTSRWCAQAGGGVYVVTVQFAAATGNSTITLATYDVEGE